MSRPCRSVAAAPPMLDLRRAALAVLAALTLGAAPKPSAVGSFAPPPSSWTETASREFYDSDLKLKWRHLNGDWRDAADTAQGDKAFASGSAGPGDRELRIDVTRYVQRFGGDLLLRRNGAAIEFAARESGRGPVLEVTLRGATTRLAATADVAPEPSTFASRGRDKSIRTFGPVLIRFAQPPHPSITKAVLILQLSGQFGGAATIGLYRPDIDGDVAVPRFRTAGPSDVIARWTGRDLTRHRDWRYNAPHARVDGEILTAWVPRNEQTALSLIQPIVGGTEAFATVVIRLAPDWEPGDGGKLPGFANTGQGKPKVGGLGPAGWGGRGANGLRWSARTGFNAFDPGAPDGKRWTSLATYFYAFKPASDFGIGEPWSRPVPKGRWFAYTQHVKLNTVGRDDGVLGYWLDGVPVYRRADIRWRDRGGRESEINEFWFDVFCGGRACGPVPHPQIYRMQIASTLLTRAAPDFRAVQTEVDQLNALR